MFSTLLLLDNIAIAESAKAWAKVRAQNWLTLYDGRQFTNTILWPQPEPMMRKIPSTQSIETKIFPNPAHEYLTINYQNSTEKGALLQITDIIGRTVLSQPLEGLQGKINLEIKDLNQGVYLYKITDSGKMTLNGKFTKQ